MSKREGHAGDSSSQAAAGKHGFHRAELLLGQLLLAMGLQAMLDQFPFKAEILKPAILTLLAMLVLITWVAHLLIALERLYANGVPWKRPAQEALHMGVFILYLSVVFVACKNQMNQEMMMVALTVLFLLDLLTSAYDATHSEHVAYKQLNWNWVRRDLKVLLPLLVMCWLAHVFWDPGSRPATADGRPAQVGWLSGCLWIVTMVVGYWRDITMNRDFYALT